MSKQFLDYHIFVFYYIFYAVRSTLLQVVVQTVVITNNLLYFIKIS